MTSVKSGAVVFTPLQIRDNLRFMQDCVDQFYHKGHKDGNGSLYSVHPCLFNPLKMQRNRYYLFLFQMRQL